MIEAGPVWWYRALESLFDKLAGRTVQGLQWALALSGEKLLALQIVLQSKVALLNLRVNQCGERLVIRIEHGLSLLALHLQVLSIFLKLELPDQARHVVHVVQGGDGVRLSLHLFRQLSSLWLGRRRLISSVRIGGEARPWPPTRALQSTDAVRVGLLVTEVDAVRVRVAFFAQATRHCRGVRRDVWLAQSLVRDLGLQEVRLCRGLRLRLLDYWDDGGQGVTVFCYVALVQDRLDNLEPALRRLRLLSSVITHR